MKKDTPFAPFGKQVIKCNSQTIVFQATSESKAEAIALAFNLIVWKMNRKAYHNSKKPFIC